MFCTADRIRTCEGIMSPTTLKVLRPKPLVDGSKFWLLNVTTAGSPREVTHPHQGNYHTSQFVCVSNSRIVRSYNERNGKGRAVALQERGAVALQAIIVCKRRVFTLMTLVFIPTLCLWETVVPQRKAVNYRSQH